jgi:hypothetical protein
VDSTQCGRFAESTARRCKPTNRGFHVARRSSCDRALYFLFSPFSARLIKMARASALGALAATLLLAMALLAGPASASPAPVE